MARATSAQCAVSWPLTPRWSLGLRMDVILGWKGNVAGPYAGSRAAAVDTNEKRWKGGGYMRDDRQHSPPLHLLPYLRPAIFSRRREADSCLLGECVLRGPSAHKYTIHHVKLSMEGVGLTYGVRPEFCLPCGCPVAAQCQTRIGSEKAGIHSNKPHAYKRHGSRGLTRSNRQIARLALPGLRPKLTAGVDFAIWVARQECSLF